MSQWHFSHKMSPKGGEASAMKELHLADDLSSFVKEYLLLKHIGIMY